MDDDEGEVELMIDEVMRRARMIIMIELGGE